MLPNTAIVLGMVSIDRPPLLEIHMASAPFLTADKASSTVITPFTTTGFPLAFFIALISVYLHCLGIDVSMTPFTWLSILACFEKSKTTA